MGSEQEELFGVDPLLTVILPVKNASRKQLYGCVASISSLRYSGDIDLIIVSSGQIPPVEDSLVYCLNSVSVIDMPERGVYSAFNRVLEERLNDYVLFLGIDDLVLPGLDTVIAQLIKTRDRPEIVACYALMENVGLVGPRHLRGSLILANWCQQGLLYKSDLFMNRKFDTQYPVRADHKFNLQVAGDRRNRIMYRREVVSYFGGEGISSRIYDYKFSQDMPTIVQESFGAPYGWFALVAKFLARFVKFRLYVRRKVDGDTGPGF